MKHKPQTARRIAAKFLRPGDAVIEVGAADGSFTKIYADRVGPSGSVLAVEPHPLAASALIETFRSSPWVRVIQAAITEEGNDIVMLFIDGHFTSSSKCSSLFRGNVPGTQQYAIPVATRSLDQITKPKYLPKSPRLIQIDAQGAEALILRGAKRLLKEAGAVWIIEIWPEGLARAGASVCDVLQLFQEQGYRPRNMVCQPISWSTVETATQTLIGSQHCDLIMVPAA